MSDLMTPGEVLHWLDRLGIAYKVQKGAFVTGSSLMLTEHKQGLPNLIRSIQQQPDELADLCRTRTPQVCSWCHTAIRTGTRYIRVYAQEEGRRHTFHQECHLDRSELHPNLPLPEILIDEPGYTVLVEDLGLCCYCNMAEAELPEEIPNACRRCWRIRTAKLENSREKAA